MTDPTPLNPADEALSALLDGEAAPGTEALVANDPSLAYRLARLRDASRRVGDAPTPLEPNVVDSLVIQALGVAEPTLTDGRADGDDPSERPNPLGPVAPDNPVVTPLRPRRALVSTPRWLVAAIIVALVGTGLALVWTGRGNETAREVATSAENTANSGDGRSGTPGSSTTASNEREAGQEMPYTASDANESTEVSPGVASSDSDPASSIANLGSFPDTASLRAALSATAEGAPATDGGSGDGFTPTSDSIERCAGQLQALLGRDYSLDGEPVLRGIATVDGVQLLVYDLSVVDSDGLIAAVPIDTCNPELIIQL